ncbi:MAG: ferritin [Peptostreptococcaceae bacterium]|nr:ferritin [Peptostreptococcaceae bacterium]
MISEKLIQGINEQITKEFASEFVYIAMEAYFKGRSLDGFANFFHIQALEERDHAYLFFNHLYRLGAEVKLADFKMEADDFKNDIEVFEQFLKHEQMVTASIVNLMDIARENKDYQAESLLKWFIDEQIEEEENATALLEKMKLIDGNPNGMFMLDAELAARVYTPITTIE